MTPIHSIPFHEVRRALVIKLRHHGDVLLSSPVFSVLQQAAPDCQIDALVYADTAPMLQGHPSIVMLHTINRQWKKLGVRKQVAAEYALLKHLRERKYDLIIHLTEHRRGGWLSRLLKPRFSVGPARKERGSYWHKSFSHCYTTPANGQRHTVEQNLDALRRIGLHPQPEERRLVLVPGAAAERKVKDLLSNVNVAPGQFIHIHPGSRWRFKCWPIDKMAMLIEKLQAQGYPVVLTGAPDDTERAMVAAIQAKLKVSAVDFVGQLSLRELAALTAQAKIFVGVDSAPMHISAAMNTPLVALFGPSSERTWGPWMVMHRIVSSKHSCRPCGLDGCGGSKVSDCLTIISVEQVYAECLSLLAGQVAVADKV